MVRSGLDVEGRAAVRAPQLRVGEGVDQPKRERERAPEQLTEEAWSLLMPGAIAAKLRESSANTPPYSPGVGYWLRAICRVAAR